jgi:hypothetical protein
MAQAFPKHIVSLALWASPRNDRAHDLYFESVTASSVADPGSPAAVAPTAAVVGAAAVKSAAVMEMAAAVKTMSAMSAMPAVTTTGQREVRRKRQSSDGNQSGNTEESFSSHGRILH